MLVTVLVILNCAATAGLFILLAARRGHTAAADAPDTVTPQFQRQAELLGALETRLREELRRTEKASIDAATALREEQRQAAATLRTELDARLGTHLANTLQRLDTVRLTLDQQLTHLREATLAQLTTLRAENQKKLDEMRAVVDEKLQATLQARLGEAFKQVSDRLEQVHKGLGEMQTIATEIGGLKRVLGNVKARGILGEAQLDAILTEFLTPDQIGRNVETTRNSGKRVEFAVRMPGRGDGEPFWLPIDAKFPKEDYERLLDARDRADRDAALVAERGLAASLMAFAKDIRAKYIDPPHTTDFALLFLPTEGLYAEVLQQPGLTDRLQNEFRVIVTGPTTLAALLQSLQMGFRTLALEKRSSEVWALLGAVKTEFGRFGEVLDRVKRQLDTAANTIETAGARTRAIERKLRGVQELPADEAALLLPTDTAADADAADARADARASTRADADAP